MRWVQSTPPNITPRNGGTVSMRAVLPPGPAGLTGLQGLPGPGSAAWQASTAVTTGAIRQAPDGSYIKSTADRTTRSSFDATEEGFWTSVGADPTTFDGKALSASLAAGAPRVRFLDAYSDFFDGQNTVWVVGQATAATATSAVVAAGATVIPVADATGLSAGVCLVVKEGTADQQIVVVQSVAGNDVTVAPTLDTPLANGEAVSPLWVNFAHLTDAGWTAYYYWLFNSASFPDPGNGDVVLLYDSWGVMGATQATAQLAARFPNATLVNKAVSGNNSQQFLDRFDADVTGTPAVVVFDEPGVNDVYVPYSTAQQADHLAQLVTKVRALGAVPVYPGPVPLQEKPTESAASETSMSTAIGDGTLFPAFSPASAADLYPALPDTFVDPTANGDVSLGHQSLAATRTGVNNVAVGYQVLGVLSSGTWNTGVGYQALTSATTGQRNTGIGYRAGLLISSGQENVMVGRSAGDAVTTGSRNVLIGAASDAAAASANVVAVGYLSKVQASNGLAVGVSTSVTADGGVAIGTDSGGAGAAASTANDFVLGTANHRYKMPGLPTMAPAAGSGYLWNDAGVVKVA